jgi:hypothetical protein
LVLTLWCQQQLDPIAIQDIGWVHFDSHYPPLSIDKQMPLAACHLLATIVTAQAPYTRCFHRLAIHNTSARFWITPGLLAALSMQGRMNPFPSPIKPPLTEIMIHCLSGWKIVG